MCESWSVTAKAIELLGALMLILPLYKAVIVQWRYLRAADHHTRLALNELRDRARLPGATEDSVVLAADIIRDKPVIIAGRFTPLEMIIIVLGGLFLLAGGFFEILERAHQHTPVCQFLAILVTALGFI